MGYYSRVGLGLTLLDVSENDQIRNIQYNIVMESCIYNRLVEHGHRILLSSPDPTFLGVPWMPPCCASSGFQQCFRRVSPVSHYYLMTFWEKLWSKLAPWWTKSSMAANRLAFVKLSMPFHAIPCHSNHWNGMILSHFIYIYIYITFQSISPIFSQCNRCFSSIFIVPVSSEVLDLGPATRGHGWIHLAVGADLWDCEPAGEDQAVFYCWTIFWRCADCLKMYVWYCWILFDTVWYCNTVCVHPFVSFCILWYHLCYMQLSNVQQI